MTVAISLADLADLPTTFDIDTFREILRFCYSNGESSGEELIKAANATRLPVTRCRCIVDEQAEATVRNRD